MAAATDVATVHSNIHFLIFSDLNVNLPIAAAKNAASGRHHMKFSHIACAIALAAVTSAGASAAESGTYKRPNGDLVKVTTSGGKLFARSPAANAQASKCATA
ncbi:MAG: hypothetical protein H6872_13675 [Methylobacteriaceae bacterium]|nr:hypothetical protein [Methylobacteriaceae bacterium]